jgi:hypothetical protein
MFIGHVQKKDNGLCPLDSRGCYWGVTIRWLLQVGKSRVRILLSALGPGVYSTSNRNEYQKIFLGEQSAAGA